MARQHISLFSSAFLIFLLASALETTQASVEVNQVNVVVEGLVYCQSCDRLGSWSLSGATPISMAKVSVDCRDYKNRVSFYQVFSTDPNGYFYAELKGYQMNHFFLDHPLQSCKIRPVSSPNSNCNLLSNVNLGIDGTPLRYENKWLLTESYVAIVYEAGPLAFMPNYCPSN